MKGKKFPCFLLGAAGMVVGLALVAVHAANHPRSRTAEWVHGLARVIYPSDNTLRPLTEPGFVPAPDTPEETVVADVRLPVPSIEPETVRLMPAPEVVEVLEPIVIEPPLAEPRTGVEESEFRLVPGTRGSSSVPPLPGRMPMADEEPVDCTRDTVPCVLTRWMQTVRSILGDAPSATPTGTLLPPAGEEESSLEGNQSSLPNLSMPADHMHPPHCPYSGGRCLPSHYQIHEIPSVQRMMPMAK